MKYNELSHMAWMANLVCEPCLDIINGTDNELREFQYLLHLTDTQEYAGIAEICRAESNKMKLNLTHHKILVKKHCSKLLCNSQLNCVQ